MKLARKKTNMDYKEKLEFLAKDEEEAIEGYDKVIE